MSAQDCLWTQLGQSETQNSIGARGRKAAEARTSSFGNINQINYSGRMKGLGGVRARLARNHLISSAVGATTHEHTTLGSSIGTSSSISSEVALSVLGYEDFMVGRGADAALCVALW